MTDGSAWPAKSNIARLSFGLPDPGCHPTPGTEPGFGVELARLVHRIADGEPPLSLVLPVDLVVRDST